MRVLVTGASNPVGRAIVAALVKAGHAVRAFGGEESHLDGMPSGPGTLTWYPGHVETGGQIEPALSERQALVHAANIDEVLPGRAGRQAHAVKIERGTRYARYAAEREQVDHFIVVTPAEPARVFAPSHNVAVGEARQTHGVINVQVVEHRADPEETAQAVARLLPQLPELGKQPGRENDAVTA